VVEVIKKRLKAPAVGISGVKPAFQSIWKLKPLKFLFIKGLSFICERTFINRNNVR
jgi:hypothetical protein